MDQKLREEFRAYKVETEDRLKRLEAAIKVLSEPKDADAGQKAGSKSTAASETKS